jgi:formylglycine-generating enzyme required for sulfatase activity
MGGARARGGAAVLLALGLVAGCQQLPYGEVLVVADTDVAVPDQVAALRIDLYDENGAWFQSRDVATLSRDAWPVSFAVYTDGSVPKRVRVRLRAYPDGRVRDYRGAPWAPTPAFTEPPAPTTLDELCNTAQPLPPRTERTVRYGRDPFTATAASAGCDAVSGGAAGVTITIAQNDTYHFEVVRASPDGARGEKPGDTILWLRGICRTIPSQWICNDDLVPGSGNLLSGFDVTLPPGTYTLLVGGKFASPADVTLAWARTSEWNATPDGGAPPDAATPPPDAAAPAGARLIVDGVDQTPATEPQPGVTIDRVFDVTVAPGTRRTAAVLLSGECFGAAADLDGARACTDTAGQLDPVTTVALRDGLDHGGPTRAGTWAAAAPTPCSATPRAASTAADGTPLLDDEVCVPGGAFRLGDEDIIGTPTKPYPEQIAVVEPFLIDRYEVTVGRYRAALAAGFDPPEYTLLDPGVNNGPIKYTTNPLQKCTYNGDVSGPALGIDRETFPLSCVSWYTARLFCQFHGADLATLAQWEYAARMAGKTVESTFPWGDAEPGCETAWFDHGSGNNCPFMAGPVAVDAAPWVNGDVTPNGVVGLGGNVSEWVLDSGRAFADSCWWQRPLRDVGCFEQAAPFRYQKGAFYAEAVAALRSAQSSVDAAGLSLTGTGFRCARPGR